jgi:hypothetical protein
MHYLVTAGKHVNDIRAIARQPPIKTMEKPLEVVFSVGSDPKLYSEDPKPTEFRRDPVWSRGRIPPP